MINALFIGCVLIVFLSIWQRYHHKYLMTKFKYQIYSLRDRLRFLAINSKVDCESWVFDYFNHSFSKSIRSSYYITLFRLFILSIIHKNDKNLDNFYDQLMDEISKNEHLQKIQEEYVEAVKSYIIGQHFISTTFFIKPLSQLILGATKAAQELNRQLKGILIYPETSASSYQPILEINNKR